jgi:YD repeat-containing protein
LPKGRSADSIAAAKEAAVPKVLVYRTPLPDPFHYSLFGDKPHPKEAKAADYLFRDAVYDAEGRLLSLCKHAEDDAIDYRQKMRYQGGRLVEEREEFVEVGSVVTRAHEYDGTMETVRILFDGELDEIVVREHRIDGSPASERSEDSSGGLRSLTEWDAAGRVVHSESIGGVQHSTYDDAGNLVELVVEKDGIETIEKTCAPHGNVEEVEIWESGELVGKRALERGGGKATITETRGDEVISVRTEEYDGDGRLVHVEDSTTHAGGYMVRTIGSFTIDGHGKVKREDISSQQLPVKGGLSIGPNVLSAGFREMNFGANGRISEVLLAGFGNRDPELEDDSYYRFEYAD